MKLPIPGFVRQLSMLDFVHNNNPVSVYKALAAFQENDEFPDFLESYEFPDQDTLTKYSSTAFADPDTRSFPIMDPSSTLLSAACFYGEPGGSTEIESELLKAAEAQGITGWVEKVKTYVRPLEKRASRTDSDYALVLDYGDYRESLLPIYDEFTIGESARALTKSIMEGALPLTKAASVARTIKEKAESLGMRDNDLPGLILKFAGDRMIDSLDASIQLELRKKFVDKETGELYTELFKCAMTDDKNADEYVEMIEDLDRLHIDLPTLRYTGMEDAWSAIHSGMETGDLEKVASEYMTLTVDGESCTMPVQAILDIPEPMIKAAFRKDTSEKILAATSTPADYKLGAALDALDNEIKRELLSLSVTYAR